MPLLDTLQLEQSLPYNCGAAAFHILYRYHYPRKPLPEWGELADPVRGVGADAMELFVRHEFANVCVGHLDLKHLRFLASFTPVLCIITVAPDCDHWSCVRGVTRQYVWTQDPDTGRRRYTHDEWMRVWCDSTAGGAYPRFAVTGWR